MPPVMHRDEAILMPRVNICEAYIANTRTIPQPETETVDSESWEEKLRHVDGGGEWRVFDDHIPGSRASNDEVDSSREMWPLLLLYRGVFFFTSTAIFSWVVEQNHLQHDKFE